jgi:Fe-S-cluster containining protein
VNLEFDPDLNYTCVQCGRSCTGWNVWLNPTSERLLKDHPLTLRVIQERGQAFVKEDGGTKMFRDAEHPACGFLTNDKLCSIHSEIGYEHKPIGCQQFPIFFTSMPDGTTRVSASFACKGVREQAGPRLAAQEESARQLLARGAVQNSVGSIVEVGGGVAAPWQALAEWEGHFEVRRDELGWDGALAGSALLVAMCLVGRQPGSTLSRDELGACWSLPVPGGLEDTLWMLRTVLTMGLLKPCLYDNDRALWQRIDQGFLGECDLEIPEYGWQAPAAELDAFVRSHVAGRFTPEIDRYRRALYYRKSHLTVAGLLPGLLMLWSLPPLVELLTALHAWKRQAQPELQDCRAALDTVEMSLIAHSGNGALVYRQVAQHLLHFAAVSA